ncbi:RraA family protein [Phytohabitans flavus]|uniref:Putative 4-hydroxy-4-methyl-2-oxoglutarate aldolase n=1 Tax=Phytohabitans flavus TaxID=1076124 RepID=A0A6F8XVK8_9ACTN|nr:4-carboxy-4-hydroxy-2-oxoadipate aldolase/oxaloacetate decarboxylase [Phytohabitans flavus]BCB77892.1 demethylmenaquinone methyltransferase [Phytohabitans flavus]
MNELLTLGTATVYEASKRDCVLPHRLRPVWAGAAVVGPALPVSTAAGDNLPLHRAVEEAMPGEVLVVDGQDAPHGYWGEVLTVAAQRRGVAGLVIDGGVRDIERIGELRFPVFSSSVAVPGTVKSDPGTVGERITLGRVAVRRGDIVVADADGVIVLDPQWIDSVLPAARARQATEADHLERIRRGELTMDIYGLRALGKGR